VKISFIEPSGKEKHYDLTNTPHRESFAFSRFFSLAGTIVKSDKSSGYKYIRSSHWQENKNRSGWVYMICIEGKIIKIGQTDATLNSRFSSYQAGTRKNRIKGTCSVTNWYLSEVWRQFLDKDAKIEIFVMQAPEMLQEVNVFGVRKQVRNKLAYVYESAALDKFEKQYGKFPILSKNTNL